MGSETKTKFLTLSEAAKLTGYTPGYLNFLCKKKTLRGQKIGRNWFTTKEWLNDFLKAHETNGKGGGLNLVEKRLNERVEKSVRDEKIENVEEVLDTLDGIEKQVQLSQIDKEMRRIIDRDLAKLEDQRLGITGIKKSREILFSRSAKLRKRYLEFLKIKKFLRFNLLQLEDVQEKWLVLVSQVMNEKYF